MNGTELLAEFRKTRSETAFSELVRHYTNLVYSVALRRLGNDSQAQEIAHLVFIHLAKAAPALSSEAQLVAWLHRTTVYTAINLWRSEIRRRAREEYAAAMEKVHLDNASWNAMAPVLDEALDKLSKADRHAILLRFFDEKTMREIGQVLGISEDAAKMRVSRAVERLRTQLGACGVTCGTAALCAMLSEHSVKAAPASLVAALALLQVPAAASVGLWGLALNAWKVKVAVAATVALVTAVIFVHRTENPKFWAKSISQTNVSPAEVTGVPVSSNTLADTVQDENQPDPIQLLHTVIQARKRIHSGTMEFEAWWHGFDRPDRDTNQVRVKVVFDDVKRRFDSVGSSYSYVGVGEVSETNQAKMRELGLDRESGIKAGLLELHEAHNVNIWDGSLLLGYSERDGRPSGTTIQTGEGGSIYYLFDPRCLGLSPHLSPNQTIDTVLNIFAVQSIQMMGKETVEGVPTWRVRIMYSIPLELWIDESHPERVRKLTWNGNVLSSKFDDSHPADPIPVEVRVKCYVNGSLRDESLITRLDFKANVPIAPACFTLSGLNMAIGTDVVDYRISRRIGYWNGVGLSDNLPRKPKEGDEVAEQIIPDVTKLMEVLQKEPSSADALESAKYIILNTPDGTNVDQAAEVIQKYHLADAGLADLCQELQRFRHQSSRKLLEAVLNKNPDTEVRANACFTLATLLKDQADHGKNKKATAEAEKYFVRSIAQFGDVKIKGNRIADLANPELNELRRLIIGQPAPQTEGTDLDGNKLNLSDYRGKVVVLVFWGDGPGCKPEMKVLRELQERQAGKSLAIVGVYSDTDLTDAKAFVEEHKITWPSFFDGRNGPISKAWNNNGWPIYHIIDEKGVIRHRHLWWGDLDKAVDELLSK